MTQHNSAALLAARISAIKEELRPLQNKYDSLKDQENKVALQKLIGNCYAAKDSYGSGDTWLVYIKVIGVSDSTMSYLKCISATEHHGNIEIGTCEKPESSLTDVYDNGCKRISPSAFNERLNKLISKIQELNKK